MKVLIRKEQNTDFANIYTLNKEAFGRPDESDLITRLRQEKEYLPDLALVAEYESVLVGHIMFSIIMIGGVFSNVVALAPMAVLPEFQKKGIGSQLVDHAIKLARKQGYNAMVVLGHPDFYSKFGFIKASSKGIICPYDGVPDEAFMVLELTDGALNGVSGLLEYSRAFGTIN